MSARSISFVVTIILLACVAYIEFLSSRKPTAPAVLIVSGCREPKPRMRRIGDYGFGFDIPADDLTIQEGSGDMPPAPHGYSLRPKNSQSVLDISWRSEAMRLGEVPEDPALTFSGHVEKRRIVDDNGNVIGEDSWGYWDSGERWRRIRLLGWITARYGSVNKRDLASYGVVHEKDATLFDGIISSACKL
jgi:hypothetical protein